MPPSLDPSPEDRSLYREPCEELQMEAMLYVLRDPAVDIEAFEAKMESDPAWMEAVLWASEIVCSMREAPSGVLPHVEDNRPESHDTLPSAPSQLVTLNTPANESSVLTKSWLFAVCASFLMAAFFWQASLPKSADDLGVHQIVHAWSEFQSDHPSDVEWISISGSSLRSNEEEMGTNESDWNANDANEVPDWLILATTIKRSEKELLQ